jgi:hypothetical protein
MQRRTLLKTVTFFSLGAIATPLLGQSLNLGTQPSLEAAIEAELLHLFSSLESAKIVGNEYLKTYPDRFDKERFLAQLCTDCQQDGFSAQNVDRIRDWLQARQQQDFTDGRIIQLQGWMLSETEVNLCALAALSNPV